MYMNRPIIVTIRSHFISRRGFSTAYFVFIRLFPSMFVILSAFLEGLAVGTLNLVGVIFVGADLNLFQRAKFVFLAMIYAVINCTGNRFIYIFSHDGSP